MQPLTFRTDRAPHGRHGALAALFTMVAALSAAGCINGSPNGPAPAHTPPAPSVTAVSVTGGGSGNPGQTTQLAATASYSDGSTQAVTQGATWTSGNTAVATVSATGLVTFVGLGEADIQATFSGRPGTARVTVIPAPIQRRTLTGTIIDAGRRTGIAGARVEVADGSDSGRSATTAADGGFAVDNLAEGTFTLRVTHRDYDSVQQSVTLAAGARVEIALRPLLDISPLYGTFGISLRVTRQSCSTPIIPGATGQMTIRGNVDGSSLTVMVAERNTSREYRGKMNSDGSFSASGSGVILSLRGNTNSHDFSGSIQGRVIGSSVSGSESMTYGAPCPGGFLEIAFNGAR